MNWKGFGRKHLGLILRYYSCILLEGLRKTTKVSVRVTGLQAEISARDLRNAKREC
jgi:hypothetical protein